MATPPADLGPSISTGWSLLAAPTELLPRFYRQIEEHLGLAWSGDRPPADRAAVHRDPPASVEEPGGDGWTVSRLKTFAATGEQLTAIGIVVLVMDICAERPGHWIPTDELAEKLSEKLADPDVRDKVATKLSVAGVGIKQLQRAWTHLTRHLKAQYHDPTWPLEPKWGPEIPRHEVPEPNNRVYYRVTPDRAGEWKAVRSQPEIEQ